MAQFDRSIAASPSVAHRGVKPSHVALAIIGLILFIGAVYAAALIASQGARSSVGDTVAPVGEVVDGWMPAISAANRVAADAAKLEQARLTLDGWSSALLKPEPEVRDGWEARYGSGGK